jgi:hypothetical protein
MTSSRQRRLLSTPVHVVLAALAGLALRAYLVLRFPANAGDSSIYEELARNWLDAHVYGLAHANGIVASDLRVPGYPGFLALLYLLIGRGQGDILLAQAIVDLGTCFLVAWLASCLVPDSQRRRVALAGLWLAATCPFVADYAAVPLTEVLATFLTAAALIPLARGCAALDLPPGRAGRPPKTWTCWFAGGLLVGLGTLVRPETPLLLAALGVVLGTRWRHFRDWDKLARALTLAGVGLMLPLLPWAVRNWVQFQNVQFLAPRYAESPGEYVPRGLYAWTGTWLVRFRDVYQVPWKVDGEPISIGDLPPAAFDTAAERARVARLLERYNHTLRMTPEVDGGFAALARERTARHPLRTYLWVPAGRAATLWFTPRVELLPFSGRLFPVGRRWDEDPVDFSVTLLLGALNFFYVGLGVVGLRCAVRRNGRGRAAIPLTPIALLVTFILLRTAFLTGIETPEPRYVLECFPALLALGAMAWHRPPASEARAARDES